MNILDPGDVAVPKAIAQSRADRLAACDRSRAFALEATQPWGGRVLGEESEPDTLIVALFCRSFDTFYASVVLARLGFGRQSAMLNRSLFEDMVDAHWIASEPALAAELMRDQHLHQRMLQADAVRKYPSFFAGCSSPSSTRTSERVSTTSSEATGRSRGHVSACTNASSASSAIGASRTLHVTAQGVAASIAGRDTAGMVFDLGPRLDMTIGPCSVRSGSSARPSDCS